MKFLLPFLLLLSPLLRGVEYFISSSGSNGNSGTTTNAPYATLAFAINAHGGGHTYTFLDGSYPQINLNDAAWGNITLRAQHWWSAVITNSPSEAIRELGTTVPGVIVEGFYIPNAGDDGIKLRTNCTARGNWIRASAAQGIAFNSPGSGGNTIEYNIIEWCGNFADNQDHGIYASGPNTTIRGNLIRNNAGYGIQFYTGFDEFMNGLLCYGNMVYGHTNEADAVFYGAQDNGSPNTNTANRVFGNTFMGRVNISWGTWYLTNNFIGVHPVNGVALQAHATRVPRIFRNNNMSTIALSPAGANDVIAPLGNVSTARGLYWLSKTSAARGAGASNPIPPVDFWGRSMSSVTDIGAFQFDIGYTEDPRDLTVAGANYWHVPLLPWDRRARWDLAGVPGGIPVRTNLVNAVVTYGVDNTGASDAAPAISTAIAALTSGQVLWFTNGTYLISTLITGMGVKDNYTLRGAGMSNTFFLYNVAGGPVFDVGSASDFSWTTPNVDITGGLTKGSSNITVAAGTSLSSGQIIRISELNSTNSDSLVVGVTGLNRLRRQTSRIVAISAATNLTIWPPLEWTLTAALTPKLSRASVQAEGVGIEDLSIDNSASISSQAPCYFHQAYGCWMKGVRVTQYFNYGAYVTDAVQCEFRENYITDQQGTGSNHAGFRSGCMSHCLIEDNIFNLSNPNVQVNSGACANVFAYNYLGDSLGAQSLVTNHDPHNQFNLYEGNIFSWAQNDGYHGSGSLDTFHRNWAHGVTSATTAFGLGFVLNRFNRYVSLIGNVIGATNFTATTDGVSMGNPNLGNPFFSGYASPLGPAGCSTNAVDWWADWPNYLAGTYAGQSGFQEIDLDVACTTLRIGNRNTLDNGIPSSEAIGSYVLVNSYFRTSQPAFLSGYNWPVFDPEGGAITYDPLKAPAVADLPAQARFWGTGGGVEIATSLRNCVIHNASFR